MFKKTKAKTVAAYIAAVPKERKEAIMFLHAFIQKAAPKLKPHFSYNMLGYGTFKCTNYKKEVIDWPTIALACQKNYISVYICSVDKDGYIAEQFKDQLGKVSVGKSCIRFTKLENVNLPLLKQVIRKAAQSPGLIPAGEQKKKR